MTAAIKAKDTPTIVKVEVPAYKKALRQAAAEAQAMAEAAVTTAGAGIRSDAAEVLADEFLAVVMTAEKTLTQLRSFSTGPLYETIHNVQAEYRPALTALKSAKETMKRALGVWRTYKLEQEREARRIAAQALEEGDSATVVEALEVAAEVNTRPAGVASATAFRWVVAKITNTDLLPDEYWCPDMSKLARVAADAPGTGDAPVVPGVLFERVADVRGRASR